MESNKKWIRIETTVAGGHEGHVTCLVPVDLLHQAPYRAAALRHHLLVSGESVVLSTAQCGEVLLLGRIKLQEEDPRTVR